MTTYTSSKSVKISFINLWKANGALDSPKGMTNHSYKPCCILKAVFHLLPSAILMRWYALLKSSFEYILAFWGASRRSDTKGMK